MPPPFVHETPDPTISSSPSKQGTQSLAGVAIHTKKGRKNAAAKDGGGMPSVTRSSAKSPDLPKPSPPQVAVRDPLAETTSPQIIKSGTASPVLDALTSNAFASLDSHDSIAWPQPTTTLSNSPSNLIALGDSPPTHISPHDDKSILAGWNQREIGAFTKSNISERTSYSRQRPLSYQHEVNQALEDLGPPNLSRAHRRSSTFSQNQYQSQRFQSNPPLPHQLQAHFYGAPDLDLGIWNRGPVMKPGSRGYYCGIDDLKVSEIGSIRQVESLVISGFEGGADLWAASQNSVDKVASIDNLRGGVYNAKILPWTTEDCAQLGFPLIALVVHGPVLPGSAEDPERTVSGVLEPALTSKQGHGQEQTLGISTAQMSERNITHYQTTVEVYSLFNKQHVETLLRLPPIQLIDNSISSRDFTPPPPTGALSIRTGADGIFVVSSAVSGEVWIFRYIPKRELDSINIACVGKVWTSIHHVIPKDYTVHSEQPDLRDRHNEPQKKEPRLRMPLLSLSGRWLAYSPSRATSQTSLKATVPTHIIASKSPGLATHTSPQPPAVNCVIETVEDDQALKRKAFEVAQRVGGAAVQYGVQFGGWAGGQVMSYWNKQSPNVSPESDVQAEGSWSNSRPGPAAKFPPTHDEGHSHSRVNAEPAFVSILDLDKLASQRSSPSSSSPHPLSTFKTSHGCSYLSFAPNGLWLFSASADGKVQVVWDLMRIQYTRSSMIQAPLPISTVGPYVRQAAMFARMSPCTVLDVVWTTPYGKSIAVLTGNNTTHFFTMPSSAFSWPPLRRRLKQQLRQPIENGKDSSPPTSFATTVSNYAQPLMNNLRPFTAHTSVRSGMAGPAVKQGTRALASTISRSVEVVSETLGRAWRQDENKLHGGSSGAVIHAIQWTPSQGKDFLACLSDVSTSIKINTYRIRPRNSSKGKRSLQVGPKVASHNVPAIPNQRLAPVIQRALNLTNDIDVGSEGDTESRTWNLDVVTVVKADLTLSPEPSIPQAEIESNSPYQPFHTDRRVALNIYSSQDRRLGFPSTSSVLDTVTAAHSAFESPPAANNKPWIFGQPIQVTKLDIGHPCEEDDLIPSENHRALPTSAIERVRLEIPDDDNSAEQIVITTRRRKGVSHDHAQETEDDGFFEDDCEVLDYADRRV